MLALCLSAWQAPAADAPAFDLTGPRVEVRVTRAGKTLPISEVPNLAAGDRLWVHPDLPPGQSVHYLLVVAFLRGSTNPPPDEWFTRLETWKRGAVEGLYVTVPADAEQALLLLAPETGGDFNALRNAVRGRPGAFVRASQDLNQASLDRGRLDTYLDAVKDANANDPKDLQERSKLLARSLNIKLDQQCFDKPSEQQAPCLVKNTNDLVLDDSHSQSVVANWTSGNSADLLAQVSYTRPAGGGSYSVYVGAVLDMVRIFDSFHTPEYQYIPALGVARKGALELKMNIPPSFKKPMSVIVVGLPAVEKSSPPPLRPVDERQEYCLQRDEVVLPAEAGPLAFSTDYAHDVFFRLASSSGKNVEVPARADAGRGGYVLEEKGMQGGALNAGQFGSDIKGRLHGQWGFDPFDGPEFKVQIAHDVTWTLAADDRHSLVVGRTETLHFESAAASCVEDVIVNLGDGKQTGEAHKIDATWKITGPRQVEVQLPLKDVKAGDLTVQFKEAGTAKPEQIALQTYSEPGQIESFTIYAGDKQGTLRGTGLGEVASLEVQGIHFAPLPESGEQGKDVLPLATTDDKGTAALHPNEKMTARVTLKDGRTLDLPASVETARPRVTLVNRTVQPGPGTSYIKLASENELPVDGRLTFAIRAESPSAFRRDDKVEVGSVDGSFHAMLSIADNTLVLQDAKTALLTLDPAKAFGGSAFGPLQFRPVGQSGVAGDWQPLATLVRVPQLSGVKCPAPNQDNAQCTLEGSNLFLLDSVASDAQFTSATTVPEGFGASTLSVPRPSGSTLFVKLRDDPSVVSAASPPAQQQR
ncbi:MAG TPA: hypothetical protein VGD59_07600 [Acidisarcina sp.]